MSLKKIAIDIQVNEINKISVALLSSIRVDIWLSLYNNLNQSIILEKGLVGKKDGVGHKYVGILGNFLRSF